MEKTRRFSISIKTYRVLTIIALFFLSAIIFTGVSVRVTGSGLGCPTWPKCTSDSFTPHDATATHAMIEFGNRLFTGAVSISVILAVAGSLLRHPRSRKLIWLSLSLVAGVIAQIVIGGITVLVDLHPLAVGSHMLASIVLITFSSILVVASKYENPPSLKPLLKNTIQRFIAIWASIVVVLGVFVTAAGPHAGDETVPRLEADIEDLARFHSLSAWVLLALVVFALIKNQEKPKSLKILLFLILVQGAWGYAQYALQVPAWMVAVHVLLATLLFIAVCFYWTTSLDHTTGGLTLQKRQNDEQKQLLNQ